MGTSFGPSGPAAWLKARGGSYDGPTDRELADGQGEILARKQANGNRRKSVVGAVLKPTPQFPSTKENS